IVAVLASSIGIVVELDREVHDPRLRLFDLEREIEVRRIVHGVEDDRSAETSRRAGVELERAGVVPFSRRENSVDRGAAHAPEGRNLDRAEGADADLPVEE